MFMDRELAIRFFESLEKHQPIITSITWHREEIVDLLTSTNVSPSNRFYQRIRANGYEIPDTSNDSTYIISLRRILRNTLAKEYLNEGYSPSIVKKFMEEVESFFRIYDSDILTRKLRYDKELLALMAKSNNPFTILGSLEILDSYPQGTNQKRKISKQPILLMPDAQDLQKIVEWEVENTRYYQRGILRDKKISRELYF